MLYLKIENPGVCPHECFTTLGMTFSRDSNNPYTIGSFGSGSKHSILVLLRNELNPIVFCGNLRMEFFTRNQNVRSETREKEFNRVCVKYSGKLLDGSTKNNTDDLPMTTDWGIQDWNSPDLAIREFISNAIDQDLVMSGSWKNVVIEPTDKVRAKSGYTRIYIPFTHDVQRFYNNLNKWFLHFSEPENVTRTILPKKNRNIDTDDRAVIYRRGVRVREITYPKYPSLFDYNLNELRLDESRTANEWDTRHYAARALAGASKENLAKYLLSFSSGMQYWEHTFEQYSLNQTIEDQEQKDREKNWQEVFEDTFGEEAVVTPKDSNTEVLVRKGFKPVLVPEGVAQAAERFGVKTPSKVLSEDDRLGREILEPNEAAIDVLDYCWAMLVASNLTQGKEKPSVKLFNDIMRAESTVRGFYRIGGDTIYLNQDICNGMSEDLKMTCLEELGHYATQSLDNSRDFQDFFIRLAIRIAS